MLKNEPIRILHIVTYMGRGGLETMIMNYYRHIDRNKVQFDFLVHREFEADYDEEIQNLGGKIYRFPKLNPFDKNYLIKMNDFFTEHKEYKVVHCHLDCTAGIPLKYAQKNGVPVRIAHAHNSNQAKDKKYLLKLLLKRNITKYASHLFACGEEAGKWMFQTDEFFIVNNAINCSEYSYNSIIRKRIRESLGINSKSFVIGHVGRFAPQKNHMFIVKIFVEVLKHNPNTFLLLIGDGELKNSVENYVNQLGIEKNVIFTGVRPDVAELLQGMDCFLFPSLHEGLPVSIIEAQASGLACLISDKVPIECKKTDLVKQISLDESVEEWAKSVLECEFIERKNTSEEIQKIGFDILSNAKWLQEFYLKNVETR